MWLVLAGAIGIVATAGCGGDDDCCKVKRDAAIPDTAVDVAVDAPPANRGFVAPVAPLAAFVESSPDTFTPVAIDLSCLGSPRADQATTTTVSLAITVRDFQSNNLVPSATLAAFQGVAYTSPFATTTADGNGAASMTIPTGTARHGFRITASNAKPTYVVDLLASPSAANQSRTLLSMSNATVATLPALVGETHMAGRSLVVGRLLDCQQHPISNFIATLSTARGIPMHVMGATTYYFSSSVGLPVRHTSEAAATENGQFMIIQVPATTNAYVQMWGYRTSADLASNQLQLLAELPINVLADSVFTTDHDPRAVP